MSMSATGPGRGGGGPNLLDAKAEARREFIESVAKHMPDVADRISKELTCSAAPPPARPRVGQERLENRWVDASWLCPNCDLVNLGNAMRCKNEQCMLAKHTYLCQEAVRRWGLNRTAEEWLQETEEDELLTLLRRFRVLPDCFSISGKLLAFARSYRERLDREAEREEAGLGPVPRSYDLREGNWLCPELLGGCGASNFSTRRRCYKCQRLKDKQTLCNASTYTLTGEGEEPPEELRNQEYRPPEKAPSTPLRAPWASDDTSHANGRRELHPKAAARRAVAAAARKEAAITRSEPKVLWRTRMVTSIRSEEDPQSTEVLRVPAGSLLLQSGSIREVQEGGHRIHRMEVIGLAEQVVEVEVNEEERQRLFDKMGGCHILDADIEIQGQTLRAGDELLCMERFDATADDDSGSSLGGRNRVVFGCLQRASGWATVDRCRNDRTIPFLDHFGECAMRPPNGPNDSGSDQDDPPRHISAGVGAIDKRIIDLPDSADEDGIGRAEPPPEVTDAQWSFYEKTLQPFLERRLWRDAAARTHEVTGHWRRGVLQVAAMDGQAPVRRIRAVWRDQRVLLESDGGESWQMTYGSGGTVFWMRGACKVESWSPHSGEYGIATCVPSVAVSVGQLVPCKDYAVGTPVEFFSPGLRRWVGAVVAKCMGGGVCSLHLGPHGREDSAPLNSLRGCMALRARPMNLHSDGAMLSQRLSQALRDLKRQAVDTEDYDSAKQLKSSLDDVDQRGAPCILPAAVLDRYKETPDGRHSTAGCLWEIVLLAGRKVVKLHYLDTAMATLCSEDTEDAYIAPWVAEQLGLDKVQLEREVEEVTVGIICTVGFAAGEHVERLVDSAEGATGNWEPVRVRRWAGPGRSLAFLLEDQSRVLATKIRKLPPVQATPTTPEIVMEPCQEERSCATSDIADSIDTRECRSGATQLEIRKGAPATARQGKSIHTNPENTALVPARSILRKKRPELSDSITSDATLAPTSGASTAAKEEDMLFTKLDPWAGCTSIASEASRRGTYAVGGGEQYSDKVSLIRGRSVEPSSGRAHKPRADDALVDLPQRAASAYIKDDDDTAAPIDTAWSSYSRGTAGPGFSVLQNLNRRQEASAPPPPTRSAPAEEERVRPLPQQRPDDPAVDSWLKARMSAAPGTAAHRLTARAKDFGSRFAGSIAAKGSACAKGGPPSYTGSAGGKGKGGKGIDKNGKRDGAGGTDSSLSDSLFTSSAAMMLAGHGGTFASKNRAKPPTQVEELLGEEIDNPNRAAGVNNWKDCRLTGKQRRELEDQADQRLFEKQRAKRDLARLEVVRAEREAAREEREKENLKQKYVKEEDELIRMETSSVPRSLTREERLAKRRQTARAASVAAGERRRKAEENQLPPRPLAEADPFGDAPDEAVDAIASATTSTAVGTGIPDAKSFVQPSVRESMTRAQVRAITCKLALSDRGRVKPESLRLARRACCRLEVNYEGDAQIFFEVLWSQASECLPVRGGPSPLIQAIASICADFFGMLPDGDLEPLRAWATLRGLKAARELPPDDSPDTEGKTQRRNEIALLSHLFSLGAVEASALDELLEELLLRNPWPDDTQLEVAVIVMSTGGRAFDEACDPARLAKFRERLKLHQQFCSRRVNFMMELLAKRRSAGWLEEDVVEEEDDDPTAVAERPPVAPPPPHMAESGLQPLSEADKVDDWRAPRAETERGASGDWRAAGAPRQISKSFKEQFRAAFLAKDLEAIPSAEVPQQTSRESTLPREAPRLALQRRTIPASANAAALPSAAQVSATPSVSSSQATATKQDACTGTLGAHSTMYLQRAPGPGVHPGAQPDELSTVRAQRAQSVPPPRREAAKPCPPASCQKAPALDPTAQLVEWALSMGSSFRKLNALRSYWTLRRRLVSAHDLDGGEVDAWCASLVQELRVLVEKEGTNEFIEICAARVSGEAGQGTDESLTSAAVAAQQGLKVGIERLMRERGESLRPLVQAVAAEYLQRVADTASESQGSGNGAVAEQPPSRGSGVAARATATHMKAKIQPKTKVVAEPVPDSWDNDLEG